MERKRLDRILLDRGLISEDQIRQALLRQKTHGGLLGSHLLYFRFLTERQILDALEEQFGVPGVELDGIEVPDSVLKKVPLKIAADHLVFPFRFEERTRTLHLAVAEPENAETFQTVKQVSMARDLKVYVAVESLLRRAIRVHYLGHPREEPLSQIVELPDLFGHGTGQSRSESAPAPKAAREERQPRVLLVTQAPFLRSFLVPIFEREGCALEILDEAEGVAAYLKSGPPDFLLVGRDLEDAFSRWVQARAVPAPEASPLPFVGVSRALLENPVPYARMAAVALSSLQEAALYRNRGHVPAEALSLLLQDIRDLARAFGMGTVAADGLQMAALLLTPSPQALAEAQRPDGTGMPRDFFTDLSATLARAQEIDFPWDIEGSLRSLFRLLAGTPDKADPDRYRSSNILAMTWYRLACTVGCPGSPEGALDSVRRRLQALSGRLFSPEIVDAYLQVLEGRRGRLSPKSQKDIFVVSEPNEVSKTLSRHLRQQGYRTVEIGDFDEAEALYNRKRPDVIVMNYDQDPERTLALCQQIRRDSRTLLYAFTNQNKPSLVLRLLGSGFNDILVSPVDYAIVTRRINNSLAVLTPSEGPSSASGGFSATFQELPFVDLVQALAQSQRSVHVRIARSNGEQASLYLRDGEMVHASCGQAAGEDAVFQIIRWRDDGSFRLEPVRDFPPDNIGSPNDFILMEGLRLLDESTLEA